ncbi:MAG TPA: radical SAM protein [Defluviitoga sp.]|nr:radical SAM protein [Defluviitoga sp.]HOP24790.1 radical SAM protein [Defluviitoga sp.]HPZ29359.1 radical SAM protein [Defluviitoga sp.]HQD63285.1 radical SAM protein [Defluviitoga sp.]
MNFKYIYGPIPSRRLGRSLGISPIPFGTCNLSCVYCQLGRTINMINERREFFPVEEIIKEFKEYSLNGFGDVDFVTIVGEGEPLLYSKIGELISQIREITDKPIAVITNGILLSDKNVWEELMQADVIMPTLDAYDKETFKKINRPHKSISFEEYVNGLIEFSKVYQGKIWLEFMLVKDINDSEESLRKIKEIFDKITYDRIYINVPVRPPAEKWVEMPDKKSIELAEEILGGIAIDHLAKNEFYSAIDDDYEALISIIKRHPMNQYEIKSFLESRNCKNINEIMERLEKEESIEVINYKGLKIYRLKRLKASRR